MKLRDLQKLWGIPIVYLRECSKRYRVFSIILYSFDIVLVVALTALMYSYNINYNIYGVVLVTICLFVHFISYAKLNPDKWEAFRFYKRNSDCSIVEKSYAVDEQKLYSILNHMGYKKLKKNCSFEEYKESILSACCENTKNSYRFMKYVKKYENESGNLICLIIEKGKKKFFIDFKCEDTDTLCEEVSEGVEKE